MNPVKVAILGGSGYTAVELIRILLRHPYARIEAIASRQEGTPRIGELHPSLLQRIDLRCEPFDPDALRARGVECAFGCLPHGMSSSVTVPLLERGIRVIDLSADYRLRDAAVYLDYYGEPNRDPGRLSQAVYGLPEIYGDELADARLIANPGCYPQTGILGLAPLVAAKRIDLGSIIIDSKSGVSGAGRTPKLSTHFPECNESFSAYSVGKHRHTPEIEQVLSDIAGEAVRVIFTPHLVPMDRGIFSTIYVAPTEPIGESELMALYRDYYRDRPFIRLRETLPATKDTVGTNFVDIALRVVRGRIIVLVCEDNLIRGASGVAVQNFNRVYGFPETTALL